MIERMRAEEERSTQIVFRYLEEKRQRKETTKIMNRMRFLRQSCRCRFICIGSIITNNFT